MIGIIIGLVLGLFGITLCRKNKSDSKFLIGFWLAIIGAVILAYFLTINCLTAFGLNSENI